MLANDSPTTLLVNPVSLTDHKRSQLLERGEIDAFGWSTVVCQARVWLQSRHGGSQPSVHNGHELDLTIIVVIAKV